MHVRIRIEINQRSQHATGATDISKPILKYDDRIPKITSKEGIRDIYSPTERIERN